MYVAHWEGGARSGGDREDFVRNNRARFNYGVNPSGIEQNDFGMPGLPNEINSQTDFYDRRV